MKILSVQNLCKSYNKKKVVDCVSLSLSAGEKVGLLGPNGAGKSTTFYMIAGMVRPDSGTIFCQNHDITYLPIHQRSAYGLGYLPQDNSIFRQLTIEDNILAILELNQKVHWRERPARTAVILDKLGLDEVKNNLGQAVSGGQRRRAEIARVLALDPSFILLDEPFAGVDPLSIIDLKTIINDLSQSGIGVLITDHNVRETLGICDGVHVIFDGQVIASGSSNEICNNQLVKSVYLGSDMNLHAIP